MVFPLWSVHVDAKLEKRRVGEGDTHSDGTNRMERVKEIHRLIIQETREERGNGAESSRKQHRNWNMQCCACMQRKHLCNTPLSALKQFIMSSCSLRMKSSTMRPTFRVTPVIRSPESFGISRILWNNPLE